MHIKPIAVVLLVLCLLARGRRTVPAPKGHPKINKTKSVEKALIRMLIDRYRRFGVIGRPVADSNVVLKVLYGLQIIQILDLDENKQILHTNCWSTYNWNDTLLQWNPAEHGNITEIRVFPSQVWTPDIQLYNFADERIREHRIARVVVHSDGSILWVPQALFKSACQVEITYFPFDTQICTLEFGSWTYDRTKLEIDWPVTNVGGEPMPYLDFVDYVPSNEWRTDGEEEREIPHTNRTKQIKSFKRYQERNQTTGDTVTTKSYTVLCYRIRLHRSPSFYVFILVVPCILLSSLTVVVFWLPPESPAKMMLGMNIFVTFFLLLLVLAGQTPNAVKEFPLIGAYFCLNMIMITLSTFLATLVLHLHYRGARNGPLPAIIHRIIIEGMGRLMLVRQSIPLPEEKKTLSHVVTRTAGFAGRGSSRKVRVPEMSSNKFSGGDTDFPEPLRHQGFGPTPNSVVGSASWVNFPGAIPPNTNAPPPPITCPGCLGGAPRETGPNRCSLRGAPDGTTSMLADAPNTATNNNVDSDDSPIMLSSSTRLERDVRELKKYVRIFVNRQKEAARKNAIAMEWRTMALVLDRLFFFIYIATIGITVVTSLPRTTRRE